MELNARGKRELILGLLLLVAALWEMLRSELRVVWIELGHFPSLIHIPALSDLGHICVPAGLLFFN